MGGLDAGEALVEALRFETEFRVVDSHAMQQRRVEIKEADRIADDVVGEVVGLAVDNAAFHAATGEPDAEATGMVIAAVVRARERPLRIDGAAELSGPDDERVLEHIALLQVGDERVATAVCIQALNL